MYERMACLTISQMSPLHNLVRSSLRCVVEVGSANSGKIVVPVGARCGAVDEAERLVLARQERLRAADMANVAMHSRRPRSGTGGPAGRKQMRRVHANKRPSQSAARRDRVAMTGR
jgi:hypothetical protein